MKSEPVKCTHWYPGDVKPVHKGVYQRNTRTEQNMTPHVTYAYWNGVFWELDRIFAPTVRNRCSSFQDIPWRGVAK